MDVPFVILCPCTYCPSYPFWLDTPWIHSVWSAIIQASQGSLSDLCPRADTKPPHLDFVTPRRASSCASRVTHFQNFIPLKWDEDLSHEAHAFVTKKGKTGCLEDSRALTAGRQLKQKSNFDIYKFSDTEAMLGNCSITQAIPPDLSISFSFFFYFR